MSEEPNIPQFPPVLATPATSLPLSEVEAEAAMVAVTAAVPPPPQEAQDAIMTLRNLKILGLLLSKAPVVFKVAALHTLRLSKPAKYVDLRSHVVVSVIRSLLEAGKPRTVSSVQKLTTKNLPVKGRIWVSHYTSLPPPENGIRDSLAEALERLKTPSTADVPIIIPEFANVEAEWTGYRAKAASRERQPKVSEFQKYQDMMREIKAPTTILFFHGGAYYLMDPATHRSTVKKLAKMTGGRCYSVRYRLAPKHPFPSALLDALVSYLTLLYPPPNAYHEAVKPEHIVLSGDSAGGNLCFVLLQLLLQFRRTNTRLQWYGEEREVPLPAGLSVSSPWIDLTQSSPSWDDETIAQGFDFLPKHDPERIAGIPPCEIWPANPPRENFYVEDGLLSHPLVSPITSLSWEGSPPMYICTGWELLGYEDKAMARKLAADGVTVVFEEYQAMPHCFALFMSSLDNSRRCFNVWSQFIRQAVSDPSSITSSATAITSRTSEEIPLQFSNLVVDSHEEVVNRVVEKNRVILKRFAIAPKL